MEARFTTGFDPASGKQVQKSIYGKTQKEVREKLAQITTELDDGTYMEPTKDTVEEWLDTWIETYVKYSVKPYTLDAYQRNCDNYIKPMLGKIRLAALNAPQIQRFYNGLLTEKELSPKTVRNYSWCLPQGVGASCEAGNDTEQSDEPLRFTKGSQEGDSSYGAGGDCCFPKGG